MQRKEETEETEDSAAYAGVQSEEQVYSGPVREPPSFLALAEVESEGSALEKALHKGLAAPKPSYQELDRLVKEAPLEERQSAFRSQALQQAIGASSLARPEQLALSTALAEGSLMWGGRALGAKGYASDFFDFFVEKDAKGPPPLMNNMNCFELVLFCAWQIGQISTEWILDWVNRTEGKPVGDIFGAVGWSRSLPTVDAASGRLPALGDMVFVTHPGQDAPWHAMLSLGGEEAMSLWSRPERDTPTRRLQLSEYADKVVQFGAPPWNA